MKLAIERKLDGKQYLEFELRLCKIYEDRRHINQTCHNKFEHCWKTARNEQNVENVVATYIGLYPGFEPSITGAFFEKTTAE